MMNLQEHSCDIPIDTELKYKEGEPILYAYECLLLERKTPKSFVYTAFNLGSKKTEIISRRKNSLTPSELEKMVERIHKSSVGGASRLNADRPVGEYITLAKANEILRAVFEQIMPEHGFNIRTEQIDLSEHILKVIARHGVTLAEAETGTGKTHGYILPAVIAKRGRINDFHNMSLYPQMQYADMSKMPIVIATSSIALQRAILTEYIPQLSDMLLENGIIKQPLTAILRKGREHYICAKKLKTYLSTVSNKSERHELENLLCEDTFDLAEIEGLTTKLKQTISVDGRCFDTCPNRETCRYLSFQEQTQSLDIDIQICNHNYLLADTLRRANGQFPLIPNYQLLVLDEAHKFLSAARSMYGVEMSSASAPKLLAKLSAMAFPHENSQKMFLQAVKKLYDENARLFKRLCENDSCAKDDNLCSRSTAIIDTDNARHLRNIRDISDRLIPTMYSEAFHTKAIELISWVGDKYNADVTAIKTLKLMPCLVADDETRKSQVVCLYKAICDLSEIQHRVKTEMIKKQATATNYNTQHQVFKNNQSKIHNAIWKQSRRLLNPNAPTGKNSERIIKLILELTQLRDQAAELAKHSELICWLETDNDKNNLCAIPKDLGKKLFSDQWGKAIPTILTSGTISTAGDFSHIKRTLGLDNLVNCLTETSKASPFNFKENTLLYISEQTPFPEQNDKSYITAISDEIEKLILASSGHAAVLFTSYRAMDMVWEQLAKRGLPFPMHRLDKGGSREIERFKSHKGGVLFASGALWEGIDIPGDALSMLIIVKLPFAVPDPISEYEQSQYTNFWDYRDSIIIPEMLIKLKQGFGRLIRTETDTGVVAILDSRVNSRGAYRKRVVDALPKCPVTDDIDEVEDFIKSKKTADYFNYKEGNHEHKRKQL